MYNFEEVMEARLETIKQEELLEEQSATQGGGVELQEIAEEKINWGRFALDIIETLVQLDVVLAQILGVRAQVDARGGERGAGAGGRF